MFCGNTIVRGTQHTTHNTTERMMIKNESVLLNIMQKYEYNDRTGWELQERVSSLSTWEDMETESRRRTDRGFKFKLVGQIVVDKFDYEKLVEKRRQIRSELRYMKGNLAEWKRYNVNGGHKVWSKERGDRTTPLTLSHGGKQRLHALKLEMLKKFGKKMGFNL